MKTLKALKTATIWNCVFCFSCVLSIIYFGINDYYDVGVLFRIGDIAVCGWMVNPFAIISCLRCLKVYLAERKNPDYKQKIGKKWVWVLVFPVITTALWILGFLLFVRFTGGV